MAGTEAAKSIAELEEPRVIDAKTVKKEKERIMAILERDERYTPKEFEDLIRQIMLHYMGHQRSLKGLHIALEKLQLLESKQTEIKADNFHEVTRAVEAMHLLKYCQLMIRAVIGRKGMRGFYSLVDYPPKLDPELRDKYVVLYQKDGEQRVSFEPIEGVKEVDNAA